MTAPSAFQLATQLEPVSEGRFRLNVPEGWTQGRGAFGGLVLGALARAAESASESPEQRLRTLNGDIAAPVEAGPAEVVVRVLRRGANQVNVAAELQQNGQTTALATAVLSSPRKAQATPFAPQAPELPTWDAVEPLPIGPPIGPEFATHYEYRCSGPFPFSGGDRPITEGYIREVQVPTTVDAAHIIGYLDAYWPALFSTQDTPRMSATISFMAQLLVDPRELDPAERLGFTGKVEALNDGFFVEYRELWSGDRLVAMNQQTFALIR